MAPGICMVRAAQGIQAKTKAVMVATQVNEVMHIIAACQSVHVRAYSNSCCDDLPREPRMLSVSSPDPGQCGSKLRSRYRQCSCQGLITAHRCAGRPPRLARSSVCAGALEWQKRQTGTIVSTKLPTAETTTKAAAAGRAV